jgi:hypothetical protein
MSPIQDSNTTDTFDNTLVAIKGGTDNTTIGNDGDRLKVSAQLPSNITVLLGRSQIYDFVIQSGWMRSAIYDNVTISVTGTLATLSFYEDDTLLGQAFVDFIDPDNWDMTTSRYICDDDGTPLEDDDNIKLNLD